MTTTETDIIAPMGTEIKTSQGDINVLPLKVGQIPAFTKAINSLMEAYKVQVQDLDQIEEMDIDIMEMITNHSDAVMDAAAIAAKVERKVIEELDLEEFAKLVSAIFSVNMDFFVNRVLPALVEAKGQATDGLGQTPSKDSPAAPVSH